MKINLVVYIVIGFALLIGLFLVFKPKSVQQTTQPTQLDKKSQYKSAPPPASKRTFKLTITEKKITSGEETLKATEGDEVIIIITPDEEEEFHLHGYDKSVDLSPDKEVTLTFTANKTGRFPFELEHSKTELGALEVQPR